MEKQGVIQQGVTPPEDDTQASEKRSSDVLDALESHTTQRLADAVAEDISSS